MTLAITESHYKAGVPHFSRFLKQISCANLFPSKPSSELVKPGKKQIARHFRHRYSIKNVYCFARTPIVHRLFCPPYSGQIDACQTADIVCINIAEGGVV